MVRKNPSKTGVARFNHTDGYITKALTDYRIAKIIYKKTFQGFRLFKARTKVGSWDRKKSKRGPDYRPGGNRDGAYFEVMPRSGKRRDRPVGIVESTSGHAARREFGPKHEIKRGGLYRKPRSPGTRDAARYYNRRRYGRARSYGKSAEHLLGGRWGRVVAYDKRPAIVNQIRR